MNTQDVTMYIQHGYDNRMSRKELSFLTGLTDRTVREAIEEHNTFDENEPIISFDGGYFYPVLENEWDMYCADTYLKREIHRYRARLNSLHALHSALKGARKSESRKD